MVEGAVDNEDQGFVLEQTKAETAWKKVVAKLFDLRKCQTNFAWCGQYLQRFPASLRNRSTKKLK